MRHPFGQTIDRILPGLRTLSRYDRAALLPDLLAGVSVAAVAMPVAIAYSQIVGVPPVHGIYASIPPMILYALLGSSRQLIVAPDAATCALVAATVLPLAGGDPARYLSLTSALTILTGVCCILAGAARLGFLTNFLSRPILSGYLNGIALSIIAGQLAHVFGVKLEPAGFLRLLVGLLSSLGATHGLTLGIGVGTFVLLRLVRRMAPSFPAPLAAVVLGIAVSQATGAGERGVALLGEIPAGLPPLVLPEIQAGDLGPLAFGAIGLALISFNSSMVTARGFAVKNRYEIDANQEFVALGAADIGAGLLQGFAVAGADSRTAVNDSVGGRTQITGLVAAGLLIVVLFAFTGPLAVLPIPVLAAILINAAIGLFDLESLRRLRRVERGEFRLSLITLVGVITVGVLPGVVVALGVALLQLLARASRPHDALLGKIDGVSGFHDVRSHPNAAELPGVIIYRFHASLLFFNADHFKGRVRALAGQSPGVRVFVLDAETMPYVDTTGAACLDELHDELRERGIEFVLVGARGPARVMLERTGFSAKLGAHQSFPTVETAIAARVAGAARH
jgi:high affinity sulfate transporter 1